MSTWKEAYELGKQSAAVKDNPMAMAQFYAALALYLRDYPGVSAEDPTYKKINLRVVQQGTLVYKQAQAAEEDQLNKCPTNFETMVKPVDLNVARTRKIFGLDKLIEQLKRTLITSLMFEDAMRAQGLPPFNHLFYGPGGTGKTTLVQNVAAMTNKPLLSPTSAELKGAYVGQTEKCMKAAVETAVKKDAILFIDEIDGLLGGRDDITMKARSQFKTLIESGEKPVLLTATNLPQKMADDGAIVRRLGVPTYIPLPTPEQRVVYMKALPQRYEQIFEGCPGFAVPFLIPSQDVTERQWQTIKGMTKLFSYADLDRLIAAARSRNPISMGNREELVFRADPQFPGKYIPIPKTQATEGDKTFQQIGVEGETLVCWPFVRGEDIINVLSDNEVKAAATKDQLLSFRTYAVANNDASGIKQIDLSLAEA